MFKSEVFTPSEVNKKIPDRGIDPLTKIKWYKQTYTLTNVTTDRVLNADSTSAAELADVLGTLINDLRSQGILQTD